MTKILIGNKCEASDKIITTEEGRLAAMSHQMDFLETSAKSGLNIQEPFNHICNTVLRQIKHLKDEKFKAKTKKEKEFFYD